MQPLCFHFGLMGYDEDAYDALYWVIIGVLQVAAMYGLLRPLEALRPIERWPDRKDVRADVIYTWIGKLGVINLTFFFLLQPLFHHWQSLLVMHGMPAIALDRLLPDADERPVASFLVYLVALVSPATGTTAGSTDSACGGSCMPCTTASNRCRCGPMTATTSSTSCCRPPSSH